MPDWNKYSIPDWGMSPNDPMYPDKESLRSGRFGNDIPTVLQEANLEIDPAEKHAYAPEDVGEVYQGYKKGRCGLSPKAWKDGGTYFLKEGHRPFVLKEIISRDRFVVPSFTACYLDDTSETFTYNEDVIYKATRVEEKENDMNTLYEITEGTYKGKFCEKLKQTSAGDWAVELKGKDADVIRVEEKHLEEVLPYTINVQFSSSTKEYSYQAEKDQFEVGFYMVKAMAAANWEIVKVTAVDTKSKAATKEFKPMGKLNVDMY